MTNDDRELGVSDASKASSVDSASGTSSEDHRYIEFFDSIDKNLWSAVQSVRELGDKQVVSDVIAIMNSAIDIDTPLRELRLEHVLTQELLDKPIAERRRALDALAALLKAEEFVDELAVHQKAADPKARALSKVVAEHRRAEEKARERQRQERVMSLQRRIAEMEKRRDDLQQQREALVAAGRDAEEAQRLDEELKKISRTLGPYHAMVRLALPMPGLEDLFQKRFDEYESVAGELASVERALTRRMRRSRWLRKLRFLTYGIFLVFLGTVIQPNPFVAAAIVGLVLWIADDFLFQPFLARREAAYCLAERRIEVGTTASVWTKLRLVQGVLETSASEAGLPFERFVPMDYFASGRPTSIRSDPA